MKAISNPTNYHHHISKHLLYSRSRKEKHHVSLLYNSLDTFVVMAYTFYSILFLITVSFQAVSNIVSCLHQLFILSVQYYPKTMKSALIS